MPETLLAAIDEPMPAPSMMTPRRASPRATSSGSEEHTSELQSPCNLVCRLLLEKNAPDWGGQAGDTEAATATTPMTTISIDWSPIGAGMCCIPTTWTGPLPIFFLMTDPRPHKTTRPPLLVF